jgi:dolichol-phosphate mannosyltransferase
MTAWPPRRLSVVVPAHDEEGCIEATLRALDACLRAHAIGHELVVVDDHSTDATASILERLRRELPALRCVDNPRRGGFGLAVRAGLEQAGGDAVAVYMADASDRPEDLVRFFETMVSRRVDCVFGSRFCAGARVVDYPRPKRVLNRAGNKLIQLLFGLRYNDVTNAFKLYGRRALEGVQPLVSEDFELTVELPLKAIVRGYSYAVVPNDWLNRRTGRSKLKIKEMGSAYLSVIASCLRESRSRRRSDAQRRVAERRGAGPRRP